MKETSTSGARPQEKTPRGIGSFLAIYRPGAKVGRYLGVLALFGIAFGLYKGIQDNYLAEIVKISAFERGIVEFFRETPGLLVIFFLAALYRFSDSKIFKIGIWCMAAGLAGLLAAGTGKVIVVVFMVVFSAGEHIIMPVRSTISLDLAKQNQGGASLGITTAISNLGNILGYVIVAVLFFAFTRAGVGRLSLVRFKSVFLLAALLMAGAAITAMALKETSLKTNRRRFYFDGKFFKFYMLEVFYGARKQIFITFAPYVLILHYGADASVISALLCICAVFGFLLSPFMGRLIDSLGYKAIMVGDTLILIAVCLLYGFAHRIFPVHIAFIVVCVNFVLDSVISLASMASNVYVQTIAANQEEITATLSTGVSINHVISIFIALMGGWLWKTVGIEALFSMSAVLGIINSIYAASIKVEKK
ncbi:MAG: MFS transporter [Treponema sp.]|jgi:predicted MFS family arabinose efflux permease|nr:MFS transporter [Treponema sp.]